MDKYLVEYLLRNSYEIWSESPSAAVVGITSIPDYHATLDVTSIDTLPYSLAQTVYTFDDDTNAILVGEVRAINYVGPDNVKVFIREGNKLADTLFTYPADAGKIFGTQQAATEYLLREINGVTPQPPTAPVGLNASELTQTSFNLNWLPVPGAAFYRVYKGAQLHAENVIVNHFHFFDLAVESSHLLKVSAVNTIGESVKSDLLTVVTLPNLPGTPTGVSVTDITFEGLTVNWSAVSGADTYNIYLNGIKDYEGITTLTFDVPDLDPLTNYNIRVSSQNEAGESGLSTIVYATTTPPLPNVPENLEAQIVDGNDITLSWDSVSLATSYEVYEDGDLLEEVQVSSYSITNKAAGIYTYTVKSKNESGTSDFSDSVEVETEVIDSALLPPDNINVNVVNDGRISVYWDDANNADYYGVYLNGDMVNDTSDTYYDFEGLTPGTTYEIQISSFNEDTEEESALSEVFEATTTLSAPSAVNYIDVNSGSETTLVISWGQVDFADTYDLYMDDVLIEADLVDNIYTFTDLTVDSPYVFYLIAKNEIGSSNPSDQVTFYTKPPAPTNLNAALVTSNGIGLVWDPVIDADYNIRRNGQPSVYGNYAPVYYYSDLPAGTQFTFEVQAYRNGIGSDWSSPIQVTTLA